MSGPRCVTLLLDFTLRTPGTWWKDGRAGRLLADSLAETGLWLDFKYYGVDGSTRRTRIESTDELATHSRAWRESRYVLYQRAEHPEGWDQLLRPSLALAVGKGSFEIQLRVSDDALEMRRKTLLGAMAELGVRMQQGLRSSASLRLGTANIEEPYPRVRPPREPTEFFHPGSMLDFYDLDYVRRHVEVWTEHLKAKHIHEPMPSYVAAAFDVVTKAKLPRGIRRKRYEDLVVIRWAKDVTDMEEVTSARVLQDQWLLANVELDRGREFNAEGDLLEEVDGLEAYPPLTFYRVVYEDDGDDELVPANIGYKSVVPTAAGVLDKTEWAKLARWAQGEPLPKGMKLRELRLIVPTRALALKLSKRAQSLGIAAVVYPDRENQWWNPAPPGLWRAPP